MRKLCFLAPVACLAIAVPSTAPAQPKVESVVVVPQGASATNPTFAATSKSGLHVLATAAKGSRQVYLFDGVEGPRFDRPGAYKLITDDGKRHAYDAFVGNEQILVLDGKEIARAPWDGSSSPIVSFGFSPSGKRFWHVTQAATGGIHKLTVDGVTSEPTHGFDLSTLIFNSDESRYAVLFNKQEERRGQLLMVDGKSVGFQGGTPQFSPDGKNILTVGVAPDTHVLIINGKQASRAPVIHSVHMSTGGLNFLVLSASRNPSGPQTQFLGAGGKKIEGSECQQIEKVIFSPDGKHYAAICQIAGGMKYALIDGKKGQNYSQILDLQFTADSTKALYVAVMNGQQYLVVGDDESDGYQVVQPIVLGAGGKRMGYIARSMGQREARIIVDGKVTVAQNVNFLGFSPDGSRYGYQGGHPQAQTLYLDGVEQKGVVVYDTNSNTGSRENPRFAFSPDNKYVAHFGSVNGDIARRGLVINGKLVDVTQNNGIYCLPFFTPDSKHIVYIRYVPGGYEVVVDGKPVVDKIASIPTSLPYGYGVQGNPSGVPVFIPPFEMGADGVFTFVGIHEGAAKRYRITAGSDTSVATMLANFDAVQSKAGAPGNAKKS